MSLYFAYTMLNMDTGGSMVTQTAKDEALQQTLAAIAAGDEAAFAGFYDATVGHVYGLALRITGRPDEAEEVVSDTYMQVWRQAIRFNPERGSVTTWLLTLCRSRALDRLRRRDRAHTQPEPVPQQPDAVGDNPQDLVSAFEHGHALRDAMDALSSVQREVVGLAFFRGMTHSEIANHIDMPLGSVKSHIRRGLEVLRCAIATPELSNGESP